MERTLPIYRNKPVVSDAGDPYHNAHAPVYVVSGSVGCAEEHDVFADAWHPWTAWRSLAYGYSHMTAHNTTHFSFDFQSDNVGGQVVDEFVLSKDTPCQFGSACASSKSKGSHIAEHHGVGTGTSRDHGRTNTGVGVAHNRDEDPTSAKATMSRLARERVRRIAELKACWSALSQTGHAGHVIAGTEGFTRRSPCSSSSFGVDGTPSLLGTVTTARSVPLPQRQLLVDFYHAMNGDAWLRKGNWLSETDPCDAARPWYGVGCAIVTDATLTNISAVPTCQAVPPDSPRNAEPCQPKGIERPDKTACVQAGCCFNADDPLAPVCFHPRRTPYGVTALQLPANNLRGTLPSHMPGALGATLQLFDLADNFITGQIPQALFGMERLHSFFLYGRGAAVGGTQLEGGLPDPPCTRNLKYLHLQRNALTGPIPPSVNKCVGLNQLHLFNNSLTGMVPASLKKLPLTTLYMQGNNFSCPFPCFNTYHPYANFDCDTCPKPTGKCYPCS